MCQSSLKIKSDENPVIPTTGNIAGSFQKILDN